MLKNILLCIALLSFLSNCSSTLQMKNENFSSLKDGNKIVAFKVNLNFDKQYKSLNPIDSPFSYCRLYFSKDGDFFSTFYPYKVNGSYVFVTTNNDDLYLTGIECNDYRILYLKSRFKKVGNKISSFLGNDNKINYSGDIDIKWDSEIFKITDLLILGHLGVRDNGNFSIKLTEDYSSYEDFMKNKYGFEKDKLVNSFNKNISDLIRTNQQENKQ